MRIKKYIFTALLLGYMAGTLGAMQPESGCTEIYEHKLVVVTYYSGHKSCWEIPFNVSDTVGEVTSRLLEITGLSANSNVMLLFRGAQLKESEKIGDYQVHSHQLYCIIT